MEKRHKDTLDKNRVFLVKNLEISSLFLSYLISDEVLQTQHDEEINAEKTNDNKARLFLDIFKRRGPNAFESLLRALIHTKQLFIAHTLDKNNATRLEKEISLEDEEEDEDDDGNDPTADHMSRSLNELAVNPTDTTGALLIHSSHSLSEMMTDSKGHLKKDSVFYDSLKKDEEVKMKIKAGIMNDSYYFDFAINYNVERPTEDDDFYPCSHTPRGVVYILNVKFEGSSNERVGSEVDEANITNLFKKMGYLVEVIQERRLHDIRKKINAISASPLLSKTGIFIMFLMSHGRSNCLLDSDCQEMSILHEFVKPFASDKCPQLANKPKLFFIQACRGDQVHFDHVIEGPNDESFIEKSQPPLTPSTHPLTDVFKFFSTPDDYKSIRLPMGSLFIRCVVLTIAHFCHQKPLEYMVRCVNSVMDSLCVEYRKVGRNLKQVSITEHSLTKDVFFNPTPPPLHSLPLPA